MAFEVGLRTPAGDRQSYRVMAPTADAAVDEAIKQFLDPRLGLQMLKFREEMLATIKIDVTEVPS